MCAVYITFVLFTLDSHSVAITGDDSAGVSEVVRPLHLVIDCEV
jgi:hypothetical protein